MPSFHSSLRTICPGTNSFDHRSARLISGALRLGALLLVLLAPLAGCSGEGSDRIDTGLPEEQPLSELDQSEAQQFCSVVQEEAINRLEASACTFEGLFAAAFSYAFTSDLEQARVACREARDECTACQSGSGEGCESSEDQEPLGPTEESLSECSTSLSSCGVTVGSAERCVNAFYQRLDQELTNAPSCDELAESDFESDDETTLGDELPECRELEEQCPEGGVID